MRKIHFSMLLVGVVFILAWPEAGFHLSAQETDATQASASGKAGRQEPFSLILGTVASDPGTTAAIPLYYNLLPGDALRSVHLEIEFVSNSVKFDKAEKGPAAELQEYDLAVEVKELPPDDKKISRTRLAIDVSVADSDTKKTLPEGLWAFLNFRVPPEAQPFSISLKPVSVSAQDTSKKPVKVAAEEGKIIVSIPDVPLVGCFFFTH